MTNITNINLRQVSATGCHPQEIFQIKGILMHAQRASLGMIRPHWNDKNMKIKKNINLIYIKLSMQ
jgi:hypothetical protein